MASNPRGTTAKGAFDRASHPGGISRIAPMDRGLAVLLTAVVGGILALQAPINAGLGRATGSIAAALVSFDSVQ